MKLTLIYLISVISILRCYSQNKNECAIREVSCFNMLYNKNNPTNHGFLEIKLFCRKDGQSFRIQHFDSIGELKGINHYEYDSLSRCTLVWYEEKGVFLDSLKASLDKFGNFIPIRVQMIRDLAYPKSKFNEVKFNDCGDPIEITKYQEPLKDAVISKYRYVYEYW